MRMQHYIPFSMGKGRGSGVDVLVMQGVARDQANMVYEIDMACSLSQMDCAKNGNELSGADDQTLRSTGVKRIFSV